MRYTIPFSELKISDIPQVGGKNASLREMLLRLTPIGIRVPDGFAVTADAYRAFLEYNDFSGRLTEILNSLETEHLSNLPEVGEACRNLIASGTLPAELQAAVLEAYNKMRSEGVSSVAVRSSATAEDLPNASFAGQHDSYLNVEGNENLLKYIQKCYVSLFNNRAIKYRVDNGFDHMQVALSVGVQHMVRSDIGSAGVAFTIDPESGFENVIYITGAWGLGENVVQGAVNPDEFYLFKPSIAQGKKSIIHRTLEAKENMMIYSDDPQQPTVNVSTPMAKRDIYCLNDAEVEIVGKWCWQIEQHYKLPMDIEWAKDGITGELFIVQARPETVHAH
jgi:pyruvate,water dikinase